MSPRNARATVADTVQGSNTNTYPRLNEDGTVDVILLPDDLLEGKGNLTDLDQDGQPDGFKIVAPERPEYRGIYIGTEADAATKQVTLSTKESSYLVNHALVDGDPAPGPTDLLAALPAPGKPTVKLEPATIAGFPLATSQSPHWIAFGWEQNGKHTPRGPATSFTGGQGQAYRVTLPDNRPENITGIDVWMAEPGTSNATSPGPMRIQKTIDLLTYAAPTYDLLGPYRYEPSGAAATGTLGAPGFFSRSGAGSLGRPATYYVGVAAVAYAAIAWYKSVDWWPDDRVAKFSSLSPLAGPVVLDADTSYSVSYVGDSLDVPASSKVLRITRPPLPSDAVGWFAFVWSDGGNEDNFRQGLKGWRYLYHEGTWIGLPYNPWPVSTTYIDYDGWPGAINPPQTSDPYSAYTPLDSIGYFPEPAEEVSPPDSAPEVPIAIGPSRPVGRLFVRTTDEARGLETLPSEPVEVIVGEQELMRIIPDNPKNRLPNATLKEVGSDGLPLDFAFTTTGGTAKSIAGKIVLATSAATAGATPDATSAAITVDPTQEWSVSLALEMDNPPTGTLSGSVEAVWRQTNSSGANTDTILATLSAKGERKAEARILPAGSTPGAGEYAFVSSTVTSRLLYRFTGGTKNATLRAARQILKGYGWPFRRREVALGNTSSPPPESVVPPGADAAVELPPTPPMPPEGETIPNPDRPSSTGTTLEGPLGFESGLPAGWSTNTQNATLAASVTAALSGSQGLRLQKSTGGSAGYSYLAKTFSPDTGLTQRHDTALASKVKVASLSAGHWIDLNPLVRPSDSSPFAWFRYSSVVETAILAITDVPTRPGSVTANLDGTNTSVAVVATQEVAALTVNSAPSTTGVAKLTLGNLDGTSTTYNIPVGGVREEFTLSLSRLPSTEGWVTLTAGGQTLRQYVDPGRDLTTWARTIAYKGLPGWTAAAVGAKVKFVANLPGPQTDPVFSPGTTGMAATIAIGTQGSTETANDFAARAREIVGADNTGWTATGSTNVATFTAVQAGVRPDATFSSGTVTWTTTAPSISTTTQGANDTTAILAARLQAAIDARADYNATVTSNVITITAAAAGNKQDGFYDSGGTGASGDFKTTVQGSSGDVIAYVKDASGIERFRKILPGVAAGIWNADITVSGAGVTDTGHILGEGVVNFWGSTGTNPLTLLARFEGVDLTGFPAGRVKLGVAAESSNAATWDVYMDEVEVTNRGKTHFDDHDYSGRLLNQAYWHGPPNQPVRDDVFIQDYRRACVPGTQETWGVKIRWSGIPASQPAFPLYLVAVSTSGKEYILGDVAGGTSGISGTSAWQTIAMPPFTVPTTGDPQDDYYELRLKSQAIGPGEVVIQAMAASPGTTVKRTPFYAASGTYRGTMNIATPAMPSFQFYERQRRRLTGQIDAPLGTGGALTYRAADSEAGPWDAWQTDPTLVAQKNNLQVEAALTSDGTATPRLLGGTPLAEYVLTYAERDIATLLDENFSEVWGGALFADLREAWDIHEILIHPKAGGDFDRTSLYDSVKKFPEFTVMVFTPEAVGYLMKNWGKVHLGLEHQGSAFTIKMRGLSPFEKATRRKTENGQVYAVYSAKCPEAVVVSERVMP